MATQLNNVYLRSGGKLSLAFGTDPTRIYGSNEADVVTVATGVSVILDASFNRGGDTIKFTGNAASYSVVRINASTVRITDALGTSVTIPVGSATTIEFADASRTLSGSAAGLLLGDQTVTATPVSLTAGTAPAPVEEYILTSSAPAVTEGADGTKTLTYVLTLNKAPTSAVSVNYQTTDAGTAAAGDDFQVVAGLVTFAAGQTVATVSVTVYGDTIVEADETVALRLSGSKLVAPVDAIGTIRTDDVTPVDPNSYTVTAGDIATANVGGAPVVLNIGNTGSKTVTIQSDGASVTEGVIINGNANATVTSGAAGDTVILAGNGNNTVSTGGGNDNVSVYGSGTNTINVGLGDDTVLGGTGDDTIIFGSGDLKATDEVNGGEGFDTVVISGEGNVIDAGNLVGIEKLVFNGTVASIDALVLQTYIKNGLQIIQGSPLTSELFITGFSPTFNSLDLSSLGFVGGFESITTSGIAGTGNYSLILNTTQSNQIEQIATTGSGTLTQQVIVTGAQTVAQALALIAGGETAKFAVVDTAANLALAPASVFKQAASIEATTDASAAQAVQIAGQIAGSANTSIYANSAPVDAAIKVNITDTASMLANNAAALAIADKVTATTAATVAEANAISAQNFVKGGVSLFTATYAVADTASKLATDAAAARSSDNGGATDGDRFTNAADITTARQAVAVETAKLEGLSGSALATQQGVLQNALSTLDSALSQNAVLNGVGRATSVTIVDAATVGQVSAINTYLASDPAAANKVVSGYDLTIAGVADVNVPAEIAIANAARNIVVDNAGTPVAISVVDANAIELLSNSGTNSYKLSDTALNLSNASAAVTAVAIQNGGAAISDVLSGGGQAPLTVAAFNAVVAKFGAAALSNEETFIVAGTAAELVKLSPAAMQALGASKISVTGTASVAQLNALNAFLTDPATGAPSAKIALAATVAVKDTAANLVAAIEDPVSLAALKNGAALVGAVSVTISDAASVEQIVAINAKLVSPVAAGYTLQDTVENLTTDAALTGTTGPVDRSATVIVTDAATVAEIKSIRTAFGGTPVLGTNIVYSIADTASAITDITTTDAKVIALGSTSTTLTDKVITTVAAANALSDAEQYPKFDGQYELRMSVGHLNAVSPTALAGASSVTLVDDYTTLFDPTGLTAQTKADTVIASGTLSDLSGLTSLQKSKVDGFEITGVADVTQAAAVNALSVIAPTEYEVGGPTVTFDALTVPGTALQTFIANAAKITLYGEGGVAQTLTVDQYNTLAALTDAKLIFSLTDTASALASGAAAVAAAIAADASSDITNAGAITVASSPAGANRATVAEAELLIAAGIEDFVIYDSAANITAAGDDVLLYAGASSIVINDGGEVTLTVAQARSVFDNGLVLGDADGSASAKYNLVDTAANLAAANDYTLQKLIGFANNVTATTVATGAEAILIASQLPFGKVTYDVAGTTTGLLSGTPATATAAANNARNITIVVTDPVSVAEAVALQKATNSGSLSYRISETASDLAAILTVADDDTAQDIKDRAEQVAAIEAATGTVTVSTGANAAQATLFAALNKPVIYDISSAIELLTAPTVSVGATSEARNIAVTGSVTAAQAATVLGMSNSGAVAFTGTVTGTAADLVALAFGVRDTASALVTVGDASAADAAALYAKAMVVSNLNTGLTIGSVKDTAAALAATAPAVLTKSVAVTATTAATAAEALKIHSAKANATYDITDTFANLMENSDITGGVDAAAAIANAKVVTITGSVTLAQLGQVLDHGGTPDQVFELADVFTVVDSTENVLAAMIDGTGKLILDKASAITVSNGLSLDVDIVAGSACIVGTRAEIEALPAAFATANKLIEVSVAELVANPAYFTSLSGNVGYRVVDTYANVTSGNALIAQADGITVTDSVTMLQAAAVIALPVADTEVSYSLKDTAANLVAGSLNGATNIVATTPVTITQASALQTAVSNGTGKATYSISVTDIVDLDPADPTVLGGATDITVTGTLGGSITAEEATNLVTAKNSGSTLIANVTGSITELQALLAVKGANDTITKVTVTGTPSPTVAEVKSIEGLASSMVYALEDSAANLVADANAAILNGATAVTVSYPAGTALTVTVAQLEKLEAATPAVSGVKVGDTAANLLGASPVLLAKYDTTAIKVTDAAVNAATLVQLGTFGTNNSLSIDLAGAKLVDSSTYLLLSANAVAVRGADNLTVTDTMSVAQADLVIARTKVGDSTAPTTFNYKVSDSYGKLALSPATADSATSLNVTDPIGADQANTVYGWNNAATYAVKDIAANIADNAYKTALNKATSVALTDAATVDEAGRISELAKVTSYTIEDTAENVYDALNAVNTATAADRETILGAASIKLKDAARVSQVVGVAGSGGTGETLGLGAIDGLTFKVKDTAGAIAAALRNPATGALLLEATTVELDTNAGALAADIALIKDILGSAFKGYDHDTDPLTPGLYYIEDTLAEIQLVSPSLVAGATTLEVSVTEGNDVINLSAYRNTTTVNGLGGDDTITGAAGAQTINGGTGSDTVSYADVISATSHGLANLAGVAVNLSDSEITALPIATAMGGTIVLGGGSGAGGAALVAGSAGYLATTAANSTTTMVRDTLTDIENVIGSALGDYIVGSAAANVITGGDGADILDGGAGADVIDGGSGNDTYVIGVGDLVAFGPLVDGAVAVKGINDFISFTTGDKIDLSAFGSISYQQIQGEISGLDNLEVATFSGSYNAETGFFTQDSSNGDTVNNAVLVLLDVSTEGNFDQAFVVTGVSTLAITDFTFAQIG